MHQASHIGANRSEWHDPDLRRSIDFHALLLAMAGHDLRQHLQIILSSYGWLSARATNNPERERIARTTCGHADGGAVARARHRAAHPPEDLENRHGSCTAPPLAFNRRP